MPSIHNADTQKFQIADAVDVNLADSPASFVICEPNATTPPPVLENAPIAIPPPSPAASTTPIAKGGYAPVALAPRSTLSTSTLAVAQPTSPETAITASLTLITGENTPDARSVTTFITTAPPPTMWTRSQPVIPAIPPRPA
ncbi:hypothetical protein SprV_0100208500 [Sparganum proliferum]